MTRGHGGDDPHLPIRKLSVRRDGDAFISWFGPVDHGCPEHEEALWEMEIDLHEFSTRKTKKAPKARKA